MMRAGAGAQHDDAIGEEQRFLDIMGDGQRRETRILPQLQELGLHGEACQRVELAERLVEDKEPWLVDEGAGERHALSHAARELMRIGVSESGEPDPLELLVDAMRLSLDQPLRLETKRHTRAYAAPGEERRVLKDDDA